MHPQKQRKENQYQKNREKQQLTKTIYKTKNYAYEKPFEQM
jgi:hypothetical protein